ncbi:hypothetical protein [Botrimarina mediterranea]|uniref:hypothetical protein n=1 Tax=Botrimarina mediterranea TaxID=2528022 RepID=UPI001187E10F|nr:hypothetical protein K2D_46870 [Planctomycetes bacterium K2D]
MAVQQNTPTRYHVCLQCNAKFFSPQVVETCPRCGESSASQDERPLPWQKLQTAADLEARYREQQQRMACPGCGEEPFLG